jgi:hypothetical protein
MLVVVVGTANHYIADAVAGLVVIITGALIALARERLRARDRFRPRERFRAYASR